MSVITKMTVTEYKTFRGCGRDQAARIFDAEDRKKTPPTTKGRTEKGSKRKRKRRGIATELLSTNNHIRFTLMCTVPEYIPRAIPTDMEFMRGLEYSKASDRTQFNPAEVCAVRCAA